LKGLIMLCFSRKKEESVIIGDLIKVTVLDIRGNKVKLGFEAPSEVPIHREEIWKAIHQDRK